jgi:hypothetical protein
MRRKNKTVKIISFIMEELVVMAKKMNGMAGRFKV